MELISIDIKQFDSLVMNLQELTNEAEKICNEDDFILQKMLDNEDVCKILNVSKRTLNAYRDSGKLAYTQIERKIYYKTEDVEELLNSSCLK